jgi:hypothetical protein
VAVQRRVIGQPGPVDRGLDERSEEKS